MRVLLDTCTFLWMALEPARVSEGAKRIIDDEANTLMLSHISSWEICLKHTAGRLALPEPPAEWLSLERGFFEIEAAAISESMILRTGGFSKAHQDPFDRLLAAHALEENLTILSPDARLDLFAVRRIW